MLANEDFQRISFLPLIETKGDDNWFTRVPTIMIDDAEESEKNGGGIRIPDPCHVQLHAIPRTRLINRALGGDVS